MDKITQSKGAETHTSPHRPAPAAGAPYCGAGVVGLFHELALVGARLGLFNQRGLTPDEADHLADRLTHRDRAGDDRRTCLECSNFRASSNRCGSSAGLVGNIPRPAAAELRNCAGFQPQLHHRLMQPTT